MKTNEKVLYHQIHPLKLLTDIVSSPISLYYLWIHQPALGLAIHFLPALVVSALMVRLLDFQRQEESAFGRYIARYMTNSMQLLRFLGDVITVLGAWYQLLWLILAGLVIILAAWLKGFILPDKTYANHPVRSANHQFRELQQEDPQDQGYLFGPNFILISQLRLNPSFR